LSTSSVSATSPSASTSTSISNGTKFLENAAGGQAGHAAEGPPMTSMLKGAGDRALIGDADFQTDVDLAVSVMHGVV
jgi:hypothetical protein